MSDKSSIEWTDATWNPVTGCTKVSPGCDHCYAETFAERWRGTPGHHFEQGFDVTLRPERLDQPLRWRKPRRVFVNSMSDLFHADVPDEYIARVWQVMATTPQHTYQILTKRHARMRAWLNRCQVSPGGWITHDGTDPRGACDGTGIIVGYPHPVKPYDYRGPRGGEPRAKPQPVAYGWPLPNVWLGVSVEDQKRADLRIPALLDTPAAVRFLSCEPLLGPLHLDFPPFWCDGHGRPGSECPNDLHLDRQGIDWVIAGGESGPKARPMHPDWARSLRDQCQAAGVPFFFKQHGEWEPLGPLYGDLEETDEGHLEAAGLEVVEGKRVIQLESDGYVAEGHQPADSRTWLMGRVGKKRAGRELDGRTWSEYPDGAR